MKLTLRCKFATSYLRTFTFEVQELSDVTIGTNGTFVEASDEEVAALAPHIHKILSKDFDVILHKYLNASVANYNSDGAVDRLIDNLINTLKEKYSIDFTLADQHVRLDFDNEFHFEVTLRAGSRSEFQLDQDELYEFKNHVLNDIFKPLLTTHAVLHTGVIELENEEKIVGFSVALAFKDAITTAHLFAEQEVN